MPHIPFSTNGYSPIGPVPPPTVSDERPFFSHIDAAEQTIWHASGSVEKRKNNSHEATCSHALDFSGFYSIERLLASPFGGGKKHAGMLHDEILQRAMCIGCAEVLSGAHKTFE